MKRFIYYIAWTLIIGFIIYFGASYQFELRQIARETFDISSVLLYSSIFPICIGILIRLPGFIIEIKKNGKWGFDWIKFLAIGLPSICILLIYISVSHLPQSILPFIPQLILFGDSTIQVMAGVVFGYILLDSVKKKQ
ncbi:hypothetical protein [Sporosarcina sp. FA9]|uniref:hypothetical protein n=1 Tax=Sporosarcina sp. FA9 TaxID=3413030 RepID=UPI003F656CC0